jgi:GNAT superfamily N-acetyltransferase
VAAEILRVRDAAARASIRAMVWEFFDLMRERYPEMQAEIDEYIEGQDVAGQLADFDGYFTPPHGECFLAREEGAGQEGAGQEGAGLGMVMIRPGHDGECELNRMYVRPAARGQGLGRRLCAAAVAEARALGYRAVVLDALYRHVEALPLYRAMGFRDYTAPGLYRADDPRAIHMRLDFEGPDAGDPGRPPQG